MLVVFVPELPHPFTVLIGQKDIGGRIGMLSIATRFSIPDRQEIVYCAVIRIEIEPPILRASIPDGIRMRKSTSKR